MNQNPRFDTMVKKYFVIWLILFSCYTLSAQFHFEVGISYVDSHEIILGAGAYLEPRYALNENVDLGLHLGLNGIIGDDQSRRRVTDGTIPVVLANYIRRFSEDNSNAIPYVGLGAGIYLKGEEQFIEGIKPGAGLRVGVFFNRSNFGFIYHLVPNESFFQLSYGFRILDRNR